MMSKARDVSSRGGLTVVIPSSVSVGSGSASVAANGLITFSSASSISINNAFNSTSKRFLINVELQRSLSGNDVTFRYRKSGTDNSSTIYVLGGWYFTTSGTFGNYGSGTQAQQYLGTSFNVSGTMTVHNPMDASLRTLNHWDGTAGSTFPMFKSHCYHDTADAFDGFSLFDAGGSVFNGTITIYSYNNG